MRYLYLLLAVIFVTPAFAQTRKLYLTADNKFTTSKDSASVYLVVGPMSTDSLYSMSQYTIRDSILLSGTFRDSTLTIPQGKFVYYYSPAEIQAWKISHIVGADTNKYVKNTGAYIAGKKNGVWVTYDYNGDLQNSVTYKDDSLSGPYEFVDNTPTGISAHTYSGTNIDGRKDGEAKVTSIYGRVEETRYYHDDQLAKTVVNHKVTKGIIQPMAPVTLKAAINKFPKDEYMGFKIIVKLTVAKDGSVKSPTIVSVDNGGIAIEKIIDLFKNSGKWKAGTIDGKRADMVTFCTITRVKTGYSYAVPRY